MGERNAKRFNKKAGKKRQEKEFRLTCPGCGVLLQKGLSHGRTHEQIRTAASSVQIQQLHMRRTKCDGRAKPMPVSVICEGCGETLLTEERADAHLFQTGGWGRANTAEAIAFRDRAAVARKAHIEATGCDGGPEIDLSPAALTAVAPDALTAVAELLGVSNEEAAKIASDTLDYERAGAITIPGDIRADIEAMDAIVRGVAPARLDADRTADPKTQLRSNLTYPDDGETHSVVAPPADTHVDLETGKRTSLGEPSEP